jgi:hypothetical protein
VRRVRGERLRKDLVGVVSRVGCGVSEAQGDKKLIKRLGDVLPE